MGAFDSLDIAATGAHLGKTWIDAVAHNIANVNTVRPPDEEPFRAKLVVAREAANGAGVEIVGIQENAGEPPRVYDPTHPLADEDGSVIRPVVDLPGQMADLIAAQRTYQANLSVIRSSREAYEAAMQIGRG
jgi:flagellar basal-body rod protein FlgC